VRRRRVWIREHGLAAHLAQHLVGGFSGRVHAAIAAAVAEVVDGHVPSVARQADIVHALSTGAGGEDGVVVDDRARNREA
jgi:hypothetical protein